MNCTTCNVDTDNSLFCHVCDSYLPTTSTGTKAKIWQRFFALIFDSIFLVVVFFSVAALMGLSTIGRPARQPSTIIGNTFFVFVASGFAYVMISLLFLARGRTFGKWLSGIRVVNKRNGSLPGIGMMIIRELFGKWISGFFLCLGYFWAIWDKDSQAWHDKIVGTVVLDQKHAPVEYPMQSQEKVVVFGSLALVCLGVSFYVFNGQHSEIFSKTKTVPAAASFDPSIPRLATSPGTTPATSYPPQVSAEQQSADDVDQSRGITPRPLDYDDSGATVRPAEHLEEAESSNNATTASPTIPNQASVAPPASSTPAVDQDDIIPATIESAPAAAYPNTRLRLSGSVGVSAVVDQYGIPRNPYVTSFLGRDYDASALAAVRIYRFHPATLHGQPIASRVNVDVPFSPQ
jgi:uncharacterized RDD family membrane protein YckC